MALAESSKDGQGEGARPGILARLARWLSQGEGRRRVTAPHNVKIGLALGGGFARGVAHIGVIRAFEENGIPIRYVAGVSSGAIVAACYAGGADSKELEKIAKGMAFRDVGRWTLSKLGLMTTDRMERFLRRTLKACTFQEMKIPLAVVATDICTGSPVIFRDQHDLITGVRASCAYPGLFMPVRYADQWLVDGAVAMEVPAQPLRAMGATHVISVSLGSPAVCAPPTSVFGVVSRCFQIMQRRTEQDWRKHSDLVIEPTVDGVGWDEFSQADLLIGAGEKAARAVLPAVQKWLQPRRPSPTPARMPARATA